MPFTISPEAEAYLGRTTLVSGKQAGLDPSSHFEAKNAQGEVTDSYNGTHFFVGWQEPGAWAGTRLRVADREIWFTEAALKALHGKTLGLLRRYDGPKQPGKIQYVLVPV